jgi:hypothetical protein
MASSHNEKGALAHSWVIVNDDSTTESESESLSCREQKLKEFFVQFYFQCVLSSDLQELEEKFESLLLESSSADKRKCSNTNFLDYVVKLCLQNRDIKSGKGLTQTTYMMMNTLAYYSYETGTLPRDTIVKILKGFVTNKYDEDTKTYQHPYGSWKDVKYFLEYFWKSTRYEYVAANKCGIIEEIIREVYIPQMIKDRKNMSVNQRISLCGKWLPRESGQFKQLAKQIAIQYHKEVHRVSESNVKMYQKYRQLISKYNHYLDTTQIHMTGKTWDQINFDNVTSKTLFLNKESFLNTKYIEEEHRHICRNNYLEFISNKEKNGNYLKNNNTVMPHVLVRNVLQNFDNSHENESMALLNMQWNGLMKTLEDSKFVQDGYFYPCIDVSPSMMIDNGVPLHCAIGLGLACSHLYKHNRAFTFSSDPEWIQYDPSENFVDRVYKTRNSNWGSTTNIHKMFKKILDTYLASKKNNTMVPQSELDKTCLIIFSDMQFDCHKTQSEEELFRVIRREYKSAGYDNIPFLVFWNLRTTNTFPTIEKSKNMIQLSGNSVCLLEIFMKTSLEDFKKLESWDLLKQILDSKRYILS